MFPSGIPIVTNTTERNTLYPTPSEGFRVYNQDLTIFQYFTSGSWTDQTTLGKTGSINLKSGYYAITVASKAIIASN